MSLMIRRRHSHVADETITAHVADGTTTEHTAVAHGTTTDGTRMERER